MNHDFKVGQKVRIKNDIYEPADDYSPGHYCALKGDLVVVRKLGDGSHKHSISVSHEGVTDNSFRVSPDEIYESLLDAEVRHD